MALPATMKGLRTEVERLGGLATASGWIMLRDPRAPGLPLPKERERSFGSPESSRSSTMKTSSALEQNAF
ncbi:hypothetical protein GCM10007874_69660 [Labrys miyagiensis]|uniref:Uncharacterized protein n=1 Tax=Labrys miyagiensis TaxID=346912 RepID=A0ABQ6CUZ1_9HYPH|nr:hypothetical protein GCM10007874_69660 [Labrys miyagiensis]